MRVLALVLLAAVVGCASSAGQQDPQGRTGFEPEASATDPGLGSQTGTTTGAEASSNELRTIYFDFDAYQLRSDARSGLEQNAGYLRGKPNVRVEIQGNSDERGSTEYNLALGHRRAESAKSYLVNLGIDPGRIDTISFGEENPAVRGHNETAWARNRRGDFVVR